MKTHQRIALFFLREQKFALYCFGYGFRTTFYGLEVGVGLLTIEFKTCERQGKPNQLIL